MLDDVSTLIQETVNRSGWRSGNSLALILKGTGGSFGRKSATSYEGNPAFSARLIITYSGGVCPAGFVAQASGGGPLNPPCVQVTPTATPTPSGFSLADYGIVLDSNLNWTDAEQADILIAANETGNALFASGKGTSSVDAFRKILEGMNGSTLRQIQISRTSGGGSYCSTTKNPIPSVSAYIQCDISVTMNKFTTVHEFGHVLVGRTTIGGTSSYLTKVANPKGAGLALYTTSSLFVMGPRNIPINARTLSDWQRSDYILDNGWGSAAQWNQTSVYEYPAPAVPPMTPTGFPIRIPAIGPCGAGAPTNIPPVLGTPFPFPSVP